MEQKIITLILDEIKAQHKSKSSFAKEIGVSKQTVTNWSVGRRGISLNTADKALKALGISVEIGAGNEID